MISHQKYKKFLSITRQITNHREFLARPRIEAQILSRVGSETSNEDLLSHLIATSIMRRIDRNLFETRNIYIECFDIPQIELFYRLSQAVPFIAEGHSIANQYIINHLKNFETATIFDIGIGNGEQVINLLKSAALSRDKIPKLEKLNIIGLDPVKSSIRRVIERLDPIKKEMPFRVSFFPICKVIEELSPTQIHGIKTLLHNKGGLFIISSFALHHTVNTPYDVDVRDQVINRLVALEPELMVLVEPHSDHNTENLAKRLHNAWQHFGTVFKCIDASGFDKAMCFTLKEKFFGREIRDIFGVSDFFRCERHELYDAWMMRLVRAGCHPVSSRDICVNLPSYCFHKIDDGIVRMGYDGTVVVVVLAYRPEGR